jgi:hypothetical protein
MKPLTIAAILAGLAIGTLCRLHQLQRDLDAIKAQHRAVPVAVPQFRLERSELDVPPWSQPIPEIIWL